MYIKNYFLFSFPYSCSAVLPYLPSSRADRRQTRPGTLHLWSFPCATSSCVSLLNWSHKILLIILERTFDSASALPPLLTIQINPPVGVEHPPRGCWAPLFAFQDQRPRPCTCATWSACQRHANEHVSETWKWEQGEGSLGACDSHKSSDQALSTQGSSASDTYPSLTDVDGLLSYDLYAANHPAASTNRKPLL